MAKQVKDIFLHHDSDGNGELSLQEFAAVLRTLQPGKWNDESLQHLFKAADKDSNGTLNMKELIDWIFGDRADDADDTSSESDGVDDTSSSSSSDSEAEDARRGLAAVLTSQKKKLIRSTRHEEKDVTYEEMYELLTMTEGRIGGRLELRDMIQLFDAAKRSGIGAQLARLVPQACDTSDKAEDDVPPAGLGHLFALIQENPAATDRDAEQVILSIKDIIHDVDQTSLEAMGLELNATVKFGAFKRLVQMLTATMHVDEAHLLTSFLYVDTNVFQMTEAMGMAVMQKLFMKEASEDTHLLEIPVKSNDFARMCYTADIINEDTSKGIPRGSIAIVFQNVLSKMPKLLAERERKRKEDRGDKSKRRRKRSHSHKSIRGRTQLSVLMEALFHALPATVFTSPFKLTVMLLEAVQANAAKPDTGKGPELATNVRSTKKNLKNSKSTLKSQKSKG
eukprot:TRINITY_DN2850_c6_g1_i1.p1 TRINITY_DN2850_c6_g1~~TRINITY_DN2850_c6_g1_i1.p1  ORF type:complete len:451 (+),score=87.95 TRINITY_DN2850_c6_g1_i1:100-1452(+)